MLTQERLKELLHYDPETGLFTRLVDSGKRWRIGQISGCLKPDGYIQILIDCKKYYAHRLAVLYMTGKLPESDIDHIDGIKHNNKWLNLRKCNDFKNQQNQKKAHKNNKSGYLGVSESIYNTFIARITLNGKTIELGTFKTPEEAHNRYLKEKRIIHEFNTI